MGECVRKSVESFFFDIYLELCDYSLIGISLVFDALVGMDFEEILRFRTLYPVLYPSIEELL